jgi:hypothetical protein
VLLGSLLAAAVVAAYVSRRALPAPSYPDPVDLTRAVFPKLPSVEAAEGAGAPVVVLRPEPAGAPSWSDYLAELLRGEGLSVALAPCPTGALPAGARTLVLVPGCESLPLEALEAFASEGGTLTAVPVGAGGPGPLAPAGTPGPSFPDDLWTLFGVRTRARAGAGGGGDDSSTAAGGADVASAEEARDPGGGTTQGDRSSLPASASSSRLPLLRLPFPALRELEPAGAAPIEWAAIEGGRTPLLFHRAIGGGSASLWTIDLPRTIARLRQGDPDRAGKAGLLPHPAPADLLQGQLIEAQYPLPVADLLTHTLSRSAGGSSPFLPAFWPFPSPTAAAMIMTADQDFAGDEFLSYEIDRVEEARGELTLYLTANSRRNPRDPVDATPGGPPDIEEVDRWRAMHHGISIHPNANGVPRDPAQLEAVIRATRDAVSLRYGVTPCTIRHHFVFWWGYTDTARALSDLGFLMDLNYNSIFPGIARAGYMTGSGLPLPFVSSDGVVLPIFQQATQLEDDLLIGDYPFSAHLSEAAAVEQGSAMLRDAARHGTAVTVNIHPLYAARVPGLLSGLLTAAHRLDLPILSAERWLELTLRRYRARISGVQVEGDALSFSIRVPGGMVGVRLPDGEDGRSCRQVQLDGRPLATQRVESSESLRGVLFSVPAGEHRVVADCRVP